MVVGAIVATFVTGGLVDVVYLLGPSSPFTILIYLWAVTLVVNIFFNYYYAITTDPGRVDDELVHLKCEEEGVAASICQKCEYLLTLVFLFLLRFLTGNKTKPPRAHHCKSCNSCVLLMDHHCRTYL